ncbi:MAG: hypothetical protein ACK4N4_01075 [Burkholderiales bacterium]
MFIIQKITQHYDPEQDRVGLTAQDAAGRVLLLWLTQRLANRLAGALGGWLDASVKAVAAASAAPSLQAWEQAAAQVQLKPEPPVDAAAAQNEALLRVIDLARDAGGYTLTFKWGQDGAARLMLDETELRQWLGILYRLFEAAEWPRDAWPAWFAIREGEMPAPSSRFVH